MIWHVDPYAVGHAPGLLAQARGFLVTLGWCEIHPSVDFYTRYGDSVKIHYGRKHVKHPGMLRVAARQLALAWRSLIGSWRWASRTSPTR